MPKGQYKNPKERARKISQSKKRGKYFICLICDNQFWRKPFEIKRGNNKFCSKECYFIWQKGRGKSDEFKAKCRLAHKGSKNSNWKGGITPKNKIIRQSEEYRRWRIFVFERDGFKCKKCNGSGYLEVHHIKPFAIFPNLRFDVNNGTTLCKPCHSKEPKGREIYAQA